MNIFNRNTMITASILGVLLGTAGIVNHGIFEILQGNTPTHGFYIEAIGEAHRFWIHGTEGAFTLVHNFLVTGLLVVLVGAGVIFWSVKYMGHKHGATVFLALMVLLTLVGGGIGHIVLYLLVWAYATRIHSPLKWWRKVLPESIRKPLAQVWSALLVATAVSWLIVMELGIFGYFPGQSDADVIMNIVMAFLLLTVILANLTFIAAFAGDIAAGEAVPVNPAAAGTE